MDKKKLPLVREFSAGGVVYKRENGVVLWLVQERAGHGYWQIPKGHIEKSESAAEAALREVREEAGINARVITNLQPSEYFFVLHGTRRFKKVEWFLMEYVSGTTDDFDPKEVAVAVFMPFKEAYDIVKYEAEKNVLEEANKLLRTGDFQANLA